ncbi:hypothetical protein Pmar_PMAR012586 [Perkinsus marinus ATCC 50983]|uniref:Uncharacterized protein n=1 Tax=Perkinsus marinus (strain ATCC 50983 / TXsc) TaxID=423536 RepID=C5K7R8_PERM5|nr:hypothetical protein Pmar_PMAR012586 [Perkinsus marinus ATCC 50983]EER19603.1 hypothetical protein Pmar_PMAR012586 [Perkinsus marinus ATCC 50983]|eukprot:XP_002787807.1 hypothetical protein Pmar_PMAR012586 [Perkinsus marinus ATCC 50983]
MNVVTKLDTRKPYATRADSFVGVPSRLRSARDQDHNEADGPFPSSLGSGPTPELDHDLSAVRGGSTDNSPVADSERKMNKHDSSLKRVFPKRVKDKEHIKESISEPSFENKHAVSEDDKKHNSVQKCLTRWRKCKKLRHSQKSTETPSDHVSVTSEYLTVDPRSAASLLKNLLTWTKSPKHGIDILCVSEVQLMEVREG